MSRYDSRLSFQRVLVATDFSETSQIAFDLALSLCRSLHAGLAVLHVFEYADTAPHGMGEQVLGLDRAYHKAQASLEKLLQKAVAAGVRCTATMGSGVPSVTIVEAIAAQRSSIAVLGTSATEGIERLVFGSTAEGVLRKSPIPILTVGPGVKDASLFSCSGLPIVFATDLDRSTRAAVHHAASFALDLHSPLHCLHVLPPSLRGTHQSHIIPQILTDALKKLVEQEQPHNGSPSQTQASTSLCTIEYGSDIPSVIVDYARQHQAKLIVLGVRRSSIVASHAPAHITYRIISEAPCPVLTVAYASHPPMGDAAKAANAAAADQ